MVARKALVLIVYLTVPGVQPALAQSSPQPETVNIPVADVSIESGDTSNTESPQANGYINALEAEVAPQSQSSSSITLVTDTPELRLNRALHFESSGHLTEAVKDYEWLITNYPQMPRPYNNLARIYAQQGKLEAAQKLLESGLATSKVYLEITRNLGKIYSTLASHAYQKALNEPTSPQGVEPFHESMEVELTALRPEQASLPLSDPEPTVPAAQPESAEKLVMNEVNEEAESIQIQSQDKLDSQPEKVESASEKVKRAIIDPFSIKFPPVGSNPSTEATPNPNI